jgi:hypothetical protein
MTHRALLVPDTRWLFETPKKPLPRVEHRFKAILADGKVAIRQARITALHESCHGVCQVLIGSPPLWISIEPKAEQVGKTMPRDDIGHVDALTSNLAGLFGAIVTEPKSAFEGAQNDLRLAVCYVHLAYGTPNGVRAGLEGQMLEPGRAQVLLSEHWDRACDLLASPANFQRVRVVANALLRQGRLEGAQV